MPRLKRRCLVFGLFVAASTMIVLAIFSVGPDARHRLESEQASKTTLLDKLGKTRHIGALQFPAMKNGEGKTVSSKINVQKTNSTAAVEPKEDKKMEPKEDKKMEPTKEDKKMEPKEDKKKKEETEELASSNVHIFYYPWYGRPQFDNNSYYHWNHPYIPHWDKKQASNWPTGVHVPPEDIGSNFYPQLGCYSSRDLAVVRQHMRWIREAGVGVLVVSWYPPGMADPPGHSWDDLIPALLDAAHEHGLKLTLHIEPYTGRDVHRLRDNLYYIVKTYGSHPAFYFIEHMGLKKPLFYVYDSYLIPEKEWRWLLEPKGALSVRGTKADAFLLGLVVKDGDEQRMSDAGFDGFYTYFAADGFTWGSSWLNWASLAAAAKRTKALFAPSVGPGYIDVRVRPWNKANVRARRNGSYYEESWRRAVEVRPDLISITSFNEWHEGTQIEPAVPKETNDGFRYLDYSPMHPDSYLRLTRRFVRNWTSILHAEENNKYQHMAQAAVQ